MPDLQPHDIRLWLTDPRHTPRELLAAYPALLSERELERWQRLHFERDRRTHLVSRALARVVLAGLLGRDPAGLAFRENRYGRPELVLEPGEPRLRFNLSHREGLAALAVGLEHDLGLDVEDASREPRFLDLAERYFTPAEASSLRQAAEPARRALFFTYWTLKEAALKATGRGLGLGLDFFGFRVPGDGTLEAGLATREYGLAAEWRFWSLDLGHGHAGAVAARCGGRPLRLSARRILPLAGEEPAPLNVVHATKEQP